MPSLNIRRNDQVKVLTGDNEVVARKVCRDVGLDVKGVLTASEIDALDDGALARAAAEATVFAKLNRMRISPSEPCTDQEFIRRAYLDTIGVLPKPEDTAAFLSDPSPDRRAKVVDRLLDRPEFYDFWTLKFADILRANGRLIQAKGTRAVSSSPSRSMATGPSSTPASTPLKRLRFSTSRSSSMRAS